MRGDSFHFAYVLTAGERIVYFGAGAVSAPRADAVNSFLIRVHGAGLFWDGSDHQFCPTEETADQLVRSMRLEYAMLCPEDGTSEA